MDVNFNYNAPEAVEPIYIEQVFAEKPGGGLIKNPTFDAPPSTAVGINSNGAFELIKCYRLTKAVAADDTEIQIAKGSGVAKNDVIGHGTKAVKSTAVDTTTSGEYDTVTVTLGVAIDKDTVLYQAKAASVEGSEEVKAGYYDSEAGAEGALKVKASSPGDGEVLLSTVQASYRGSKIVAADDYVVLVATPVAAVTAVPAEPKLTPLYVTGNRLTANAGDQAVRLINGANLRKETANISKEIEALLPTIKLV